MKDTLERIKTTRFGELDIYEDSIITMPVGIVGFDHVERYVILDFHTEIDTALKWLQALNYPELAFPLIDPYTVRPDYSLNISDEDMELLNIKSLNDVRVMTIVTIPDDPRKMTANLLAPILINPGNRLAIQVVLIDSEYSTSHFILPQ